MEQIVQFPVPYPDETFYSVFCRYHLRCGSPAYRTLSEGLFGRRIQMNSNTPPWIGMLSSKLPKKTGLTANYFMQHTTVLPYFAPFLAPSRVDTFREYMLRKEADDESHFFSMGVGKLRYPRVLYLRFCENCWKEDAKRHGEPYWHRVHQLPGILMCHHHGEPLQNSPVFVAEANRNLYATSLSLLEKSTACGNFKDDTIEKLMQLSHDSLWLLQKGHQYGIDQTYQKYEAFLCKRGFSSLHGRIWHNRIFEAVYAYFGEDFLRRIDAYDQDPAITWSKRILLYQDKLRHPMYHILLQELLTGSTADFYKQDVSKPLPYGDGPWPCRNPICPHNRQDVIEQIEIQYVNKLHKALFQCPFCGFAYRRKHAVMKEKQYDGTVYISSYGPLWEQKLRECLVELGMSTRRTCEFLQCDLYTVHKYAVHLGILRKEEVTFYERKPKSSPSSVTEAIMSENEERVMWRQRWIKLILDNPDVNRSFLITLDHQSYIWLRKNDLEWFEKNTPPAQYLSMDWERRDRETLEKIQAVQEILRNDGGRPIWITCGEIIRRTGLHQLNNKKALARMPLTAAFLTENLETIDEWRRRKIVWAIQGLRERDESITLYKIGIRAAIGRFIVPKFHEFMLDCLDDSEML